VKLRVMTPNPPPSPEGSELPPRHRPNLGNLAKDTTESDLWAFDDLEADDELDNPAPKLAETLIPEPRDPEKIKQSPMKGSSASKAPGNQDRIKVNVNKPRPRLQSGQTTGQSKPGSEFDDLDHWDEPAGQPEILKVVPEIEPAPPVPEIPVEAGPPVVTPPADVDEFSPVVPEKTTPMSLRPHLGLTNVERVGLIVLAVLLLAGGVAFFVHTINRLPTGTEMVRAKDFPIAGKHLSVVSADSFWRAPKDTDAVRRGTVLVPVVTFTTSGGPAAIRVFFHNSDGDSIGDAVTRLVHPGKSLQVAATAGFEDLGMHAAYRTSDSKPWSIEVHEAPSENSAGSEFKKLFEMEISPDRR
jgi:hypothetical protein